MHKVIHSDFQIDLSSYKVTTNEENHWFSDKYFTKYSFPFNIKLTEDLIDFFEYLQNYNSIDRQTMILVSYINGDVMQEAFLEIEEMEEDIRVQLRYGIEEFPNFNKKIAELPLEKFTVADIYAHAKSIITQTWPAVNYNYPQMHIDSIDVADELWTTFLGIVNNYVAGEFLVNEVISNVTYNRNIIQPLPYWLHVLTVGFADAGFTLKGDILEDETIKKKVMWSEAKYYNLTDTVTVDLRVMGADYISKSGNQASYLSSVVIPAKGQYRITGTIQLYSRWKKTVWAKLKYRDTQLWFKSKYVKNHHSGYLYTYDIDIVFDTLNDAVADVLYFESSQFYRATNLLCDIFVDSITLYDDQGAGIPNVAIKNEVDLTKTVPDTTFGECVKALKNWYNLDLDLVNKEIWMNYIEKNINYANAFDLQQFEIKTPRRKFNTGLSFLLKFQDINSEEYSFTEVFTNFEGVSTDSFVKDTKTKEIVINAVPLPLLFRNNIQTAHSFSDDRSKMFAVLYDGLTDGLNLALDPSSMLLPTIHKNNYEKWFEFRVQSVSYRWSFKAWEEELRGFKAKGKAYAYKNYHIVKLIQKNEIAPNLFRVDVQIESLK